jgi:hypothetical protein
MEKRSPDKYSAYQDILDSMQFDIEGEETREQRSKRLKSLSQSLQVMESVKPSGSVNQSSKKSKSFLRSINPISAAEKMKYNPLDPSFVYQIPFEEELKDILGEDYYKYASIMFENIEKSALGMWVYTEYLLNDMHFENFDYSMHDVNPILDYIYYIYQRFGDSLQYYEPETRGKLNIIYKLVMEETEDPLESNYVIEMQNQGSYPVDKIINLELKDFGNLVPSNESVLRNSRFFKIKIRNKSLKIPTPSDLHLFEFSYLKKILTSSPLRTEKMIYKLLDQYLNHSSVILMHQKLRLPYQFMFHLSNAKDRFFVAPISEPTHLNLLIFDMDFQTIERFEPHGSISYSYLKNILYTNGGLLKQRGHQKLIQEIIASNHNYYAFYTDPQFKLLIEDLGEISKSVSDKKLQLLLESIRLDFHLMEIKFPPKFANFRLLLPIQYQISTGPQTYYDIPFENELPRGLCVTFCYIYLALRLRALTKDEFKDLQTAINTKFFDFMLEWYGNNVDSSVQVDSTNENEKNLFVKEAMVEFIVKVNDQYLGKLFEKVNKKFNLNFMVYQGRNVKT